MPYGKWEHILEPILEKVNPLCSFKFQSAYTAVATNKKRKYSLSVSAKYNHGDHCTVSVKMKVQRDGRLLNFEKKLKHCITEIHSRPSRSPQHEKIYSEFQSVISP